MILSVVAKDMGELMRLDSCNRWLSSAAVPAGGAVEVTLKKGTCLPLSGFRAYGFNE